MKACRRCHRTLQHEAFARAEANRDGLQRWCRECTASWKRENSAAVNRGNRSYERRNPEKAREWSQRWRNANLDREKRKERARVARWRRQNPQAAKALKVLRRERVRSASGRATTAQIMARVAYYGGRCWLCHAQWEHIDHVKPLSRGGTNWPANLRPACAACNVAKRDRWPLAAL